MWCGPLALTWDECCGPWVPGSLGGVSCGPLALTWAEWCGPSGVSGVVPESLLGVCAVFHFVFFFFLFFEAGLYLRFTHVVNIHI